MVPAPYIPCVARRILSWNVNGIRSCVGKGLVDWLRRSRADVVGLQETRVDAEKLPGELLRIRRFPHFSLEVARSRKGYSGVGLLSRVEPEVLQTSLGIPRFDREGRFQLARFEDLLIANVYFPNGSGKNRDNSRVPYKLSFTRRVFDIVDEHLDGRREAVLGVVEMLRDVCADCGVVSFVLILLELIDFPLACDHLLDEELYARP